MHLHRLMLHPKLLVTYNFCFRNPKGWSLWVRGSEGFVFIAILQRCFAGDLHGDIKATREALRLAGVLHPTRDMWIGGKTVLVQVMVYFLKPQNSPSMILGKKVGDQLDRGDNELDILSLLHSLRYQAQASGGAVHVLAGNHETMNARKIFRYATEGAMQQYNQWDSICRHKWFLPGFVRDAFHCNLYQSKLECGDTDQVCKDRLISMPAIERSRYLALKSGGALAKDLFATERYAVLIVGDTLFVHGGLTKEVATASNVTHKLAQLNADLRAFFAGAAPKYKGEGVLWSRDYSSRSPRQLERDPTACPDLHHLLARLPAPGPARVRRMVVGHSVQKGGEVTSACGGAVWRVDVGMSRGVRGRCAAPLPPVPPHLPAARPRPCLSRRRRCQRACV
jgi:hypothetical protein